jgi:hypothetical protein
MDCANAARLASLYVASNSVSFMQRSNVLGAIPTERAASSMFRCVNKAGLAH